jgi:hypothetical protein
MYDKDVLPTSLAIYTHMMNTQQHMTILHRHSTYTHMYVQSIKTMLFDHTPPIVLFHEYFCHDSESLVHGTSAHFRGISIHGHWHKCLFFTLYICLQSCVVWDSVGYNLSVDLFGLLYLYIQYFLLHLFHVFHLYII